jgi:hypothetical protein
MQQKIMYILLMIMYYNNSHLIRKTCIKINLIYIFLSMKINLIYNFLSLLLDGEETKNWGPGLVEVWHRCIPSKDVYTRCGTEVRALPATRGYLLPASYPKYYLGGQSCSWQVKGPTAAATTRSGQLIVLRVLDLQLEAGGGGGGGCEDRLTLNRNLSLCGELMTELVYSATERSVLVSLNTSGSNSQYLVPKRGFLLEFLSLSCPAPPANPSGDGSVRLLQSNQTHATYACRQLGAVFPDTRQRMRSVLCLDSVLVPPLPPLACQLSAASPQQNLTTRVLLGSGSAPPEPAAEEGVVVGGSGHGGDNTTRVWVQEVLLPLVLLTFLLILSLAALILLSLARRQRQEMERLRD